MFHSLDDYKDDYKDIKKENKKKQMIKLVLISYQN